MQKDLPAIFNNSYVGLLTDIRQLIGEARKRVAYAINSELTLLYWRVGKRIRQDILKKKRARYGAEIVVTLSRQLVAEYGEGYNEKNLRRMIQFADYFPDDKNVVTWSRDLSWSHFVAILPVKDHLARVYYAEMCRIERWGVRTLREKIAGMLYERTALSRKPKKLIKKELTRLSEKGHLTLDLVFRDPYLLDFLNLKDIYSEKDLESAILRELESFIMELGAGFTFIARQKRITVDSEDYYLDLLFYHRQLQRLVAIELKLGRFRPEYKGQMELYLRWLDKHERKDGEGSPIGLILCAGKNEEQIELLELYKSGIRVAEYYTELPPREVLEKKLHQAIEYARARLAHLPKK